MGSEPSEARGRPDSGERASYCLFRVDDRLLHGQVALGWGRKLRPECFLLADDRLAADPETAELYRLAAPDQTRVLIHSPEDLLAGRVEGHDPGRTVLLVRGLSAAARLLRGGVPGPVNLGGLHARPGALQVFPYLFLTPEDGRLLRLLLEEGHALYAQELPDGERRAAPEWLPPEDHDG